MMRPEWKLYDDGATGNDRNVFTVISSNPTYLPTCLPLTGTLRLAPTGGCAESNGVLGRDHGLDVVGDAARQTEGTESRNMGSSNVRSIAEVLNMIGILQQS